MQYLLVVVLADAKDAKGASKVGARQDPAVRMGVFYGISIVLGLVLFLVVPVLIQRSAALFGLTWALAQCFLMVLGAINLHHFIVDGYIWRSSKKVSTQVAAPAPARA